MVERIDAKEFIDPTADFVALQLRNAHESVQVAFGLLQRAMREGEPNAISSAVRNYQEMSRVAGDVIKAFVALKREIGTLVPIDDVADIVVTQLEDVRRGLRRLGKRAAPLANPAAPELAAKVIDDEVDRLLAQLDIAPDLKAKLSAKRDEVDGADALPSEVEPPC